MISWQISEKLVSLSPLVNSRTFHLEHPFHKNSKQTFTYLKSTIETPEKGVKICSKLTIITSITSKLLQLLFSNAEKE